MPMRLHRKRLTILLESEIRDLFSPPKLTIEEKRLYFALNDLEEEAFNRIRNRYHRCYFVLLLGYFKVKPVSLNFGYSEVREDLSFIVNEYFQGGKPKRQNLTKSQRSRLYQRVLKLSGYRLYGSNCLAELETHTAGMAKVSIDARALFDSCIDYLVQKKVAIPKYYVLQELISSTINCERKRQGEVLNKYLPQPLAVCLDNLFNTDTETTLSDIRKSAKNFTPTELEKELKIFQCIEPLIDGIDGLVQQLDLSQSNLYHYASLVDYYTVTKLKRFDKTTRYLYLVCYLHVRQQKVIEHMAEAFIYHCRKLRNGAKAYAKEAGYQEWNEAAASVGKAAVLLRFFIDDSIEKSTPFGDICAQAAQHIQPKEIELLCLYLSDQKRSPEYYNWEYFDQQKELIEKTLRPIFLSLEFQSSETTHALGLQIERSQLDLTKDGMIKEVDRRLIKPRHQPFICSADSINPARFELLLYLLVENKMHGHLHIPRSLKHRRLQDDLVDDPSWKQKDNLIEKSLLNRINTPPQRLMISMQKALDDKIAQVGDRIQKGDNRNVVLRNRTGKTQWRLPSRGIKKLLNNPFFEQLKQVDVAELLRFVDQETQFLSAFEHVRQVQSKQEVNPNNLVATIIANGTNYGLFRMAHISDRSYEQLRSTQANYLRMETLNKANDTVSNAIASLEIFKHYNIQENALHASADGQKFESRLHTFKTRFSSKYFGTNKGVSAMTLVANHVPVNARVIGANEHESHYIFDLLFNNTSDIKPDILSTDTHGVNHVNFALLDLFGYTFAPRYARFSHVIDQMFNINESDINKPMLSLKKPIRTDRVIEEWETIQRIVISLQKKTTTQASLIQKLSSYSRNHPLLQALTEYDRMIKAMYILDYIDDESLRNYIQRALNRGEAYHQLRRAVASVNGNRFRGSSDHEIDIWNECARLLTNTIIYFNSRILSQLLIHYESTGEEKTLSLVKQVSPVAWTNVNLNGTYSFSFEQGMINLADILSPLTGNN